ncbi:MAG: MFS transporter, partial [Alphaproteobacteria bacterium]|nr:MFS transporter [Alphaproteobacteria bacterium]
LNLIVLFIFATQSSFFSQAKYGFLPEIFTEQELSRANGIVEMSVYTGIILGLFLGGVLFEQFRDNQQVIAYILFGLSLVGTLSILRAPPTAYQGIKQKLSYNPWSVIIHGAKKIYASKMLLLTVSGICWFWFSASLLNSLIVVLGEEVLRMDSYWVSLLLIQLGIGIAIGSLLAGRLSGDRVEVGLVPLGALGIGMGCMLMYLLSPYYYGFVIALFIIGLSSGLFIVPLNANLQYMAGIHEKGRLIATANVFSMTAVLCASIVLPLLHDVLSFRSDMIFMLMGLTTIIVTALAARSLPLILLRFGLWVITHSLYKINVRGAHHLPEKGAALLVCNHLSYVDGFLVGGAMKRHVQFMLFDQIYHIKFLEPFFKLMKVIPVYRGRNVRKTFDMARAALEKGELVCIFAEGAITRNGQILGFKKGLEKITEGLNVPIIPVNLDNAWGSIFSYDRGKFFFKRPKTFPYPVTVNFGKPMPSFTTKEVVRQEVKELEVESFACRDTIQTVLPVRLIKAAKAVFWKHCMTDSTGAKLRYGEVVIYAIALARKIRQLSPGPEMIGIMLPTSVGGALVNLAVAFSGRVSVNLNYTIGLEALNSSIKQADLKVILTSRLFLEKAKIEKNDKMIFMEDLRSTITTKDRILALLTAFLPASQILNMLSDNQVEPNSVATVLFSSGSSGDPKGVMLSHKNILANIEGIGQILPAEDSDKLLAALPFFHSFGYTVQLWFALIKNMTVVYHTNPLEAKTIGDLVAKHKSNFMVATPTLYQNYIRSCNAEDFASIKYAIAGAEKLRASVVEDFKEKFGIPLYEGYGCTELSPAVCVNVPDIIASDGSVQIGNKPGTIGASIPGVATKVVNPETMEDLPLGESGMLLVKSNAAMVGYLNKPELTRQSFYGSWYITGDIARMDEAGFVTIVDRLSRFSKIAGEMVPHGVIEEKINYILNGAQSVVVSLDSARRGEMLAVIYMHATMNEKELWNNLKLSGLPNLWIPRPEAIIRVDELPIFMNGKVDLQAVKRIALAKLAA